jgi:hypothetical protein
MRPLVKMRFTVVVDAIREAGGFTGHGNKNTLACDPKLFGYVFLQKVVSSVCVDEAGNDLTGDSML